MRNMRKIATPLSRLAMTNKLESNAAKGFFSPI